MIAALLISLALAPSPPPAALPQDPPRDASHPAGMRAFALPSGGSAMNAVLYTAAGAGPHPTVLLLHGFPGNEQNLDLAQAMRRAGWNVLTLHYRGAWGSAGSFSFRHVLEDTDAALAWLRGPDARAAGIDGARIVVVGHSMGGLATAYAAGHDAAIIGAALISPASLTDFGAQRDRAVKAIGDEYGATTMSTLAGTSPEALYDEVQADPHRFELGAYAAGAARMPVLVISADDGLRAVDEAYAAAVTSAGRPPRVVHFATDHSYSDHRLALQAEVIRWLAGLDGAPGTIRTRSAPAGQAPELRSGSLRF